MMSAPRPRGWPRGGVRLGSTGPAGAVIEGRGVVSRACQGVAGHSSLALDRREGMAKEKERCA